MGKCEKYARNTDGQYISRKEAMWIVSSFNFNYVCRLIKFLISNVVLSFQVLYFVFSVINKPFSSSNFSSKYQFYVMRNLY